MTVWKPSKRIFSTTVSETVDVDVDISSDDLAEFGWHHEDDCPQGSGASESEALEALAQLRDWHDQAHGMVLWVSCKQSPCAVIPVGAR
jgi:hypothetical protein